MITGLISRVCNRTTLFIVFILILGSWLLFGHSALQGLGDGDSGIQKFVNSHVERLKKTDPKAGAALANIARERDIRAVATSLRMYERETNGNPVHSLARDLTRNDGEGLRWYALSEVGLTKYSQAPVNERDSFFNAYGAVYQNTLELDPSGTMADNYAAMLFAAKDDRNWGIMAEDPSSFIFRAVLKDVPDSWEYYVKERDWLDDILVSLPVPENDMSLYAPTVADAVQTIRRYDPAFKRVYRSRFGVDPEVDPSIGVALLELFDEHGEYLLAGHKNGLPAEEMADILYANHSEFVFSEEQSARSKEIEYSIARMLTIKANKPHVWRCAAEEMNFLWLERVAPEQAEGIAEVYGGGDVPTLLLTYYEDEAPAAAQAIATYGDFGLHMLTRYRDDEVFKRHLASEKVGIRVIPFITRFPEDGFASLQSNTKWIDKYFNQDGSEKDQGWVKDIPLIGGPANVIGNWLDGVPNTWGEIGWAAFDVADCALIVASFGSSTAISQGAKQTGKQMMKTQVKKTVAKTAVRTSAVSAARTIGKGTVRSLLTRVVQVGYQSIRWGLQPVVSAGSYTWKTVKTAWRSIPRGGQRIITGTIATAMFCYSYDRRDTPAAIKKGMEAIGRQVGKIVNALSSGTSSSIAQVANEILGGSASPLSSIGRWAAWLGGIAVFAAAVFILRPSRKRFSAF